MVQFSYMLGKKHIIKNLEHSELIQRLIVKWLYKHSLSKFKTCKWPTYTATWGFPMASVACFDFGTLDCL